MTSDARTPLEKTETTALQIVANRPWPEFSQKQERRALVLGAIGVNVLGLFGVYGLWAASRVEGLAVSQYLQFVVFVAAALGLIAAVMRAYAHRRSQWIDFWGKVLGAWVAGITVVAIWLGGEAWPF